MDCTVSQFKGFAIYSPVINGVGGNLVAVQASRLSTSLHQVGAPGDVPTDPEHQYHGLLATFFSNGKVTCVCYHFYCVSSRSTCQDSTATSYNGSTGVTDLSVCNSSP